MQNAVLNTSLPEAPWMEPALWKLPGTVPIDPAHWIMRDEVFAGQMAERDRLLEKHESAVLASRAEAIGAAQECLETVLEGLSVAEGYRVGDGHVLRPDCVTVEVDRSNPLKTVGRLIQEDICILQKGPGGEHVLSAACLCFPASWTLAEKIGRPLGRIHGPVETYTDDIAKRVQRMFDMIRPDMALMRANALLYHEPDLHQPRSEMDEAVHSSASGQYLRSERQTLRRLPSTGAVVFAIHTFVLPLSALTAAQKDRLHLVGDRYSAASEHSE